MKPDIRSDTGYQKRPDIRPAGYPVQPYNKYVFSAQYRVFRVIFSQDFILFFEIELIIKLLERIVYIKSLKNLFTFLRNVT